MNSVLENYAKVCKEVIKYYPVWPPDSPVKLGDYGVVQDGLYEKKGNIFDNFEFKIKQLNGTGYNTFDFTRGVNFSASLEPSIKIPEMFEATIKIVFGDESNVFFSFNECQSASVDNSRDLEKKIIELYDKDEWSEDYYVITGLLTANNSTVILADNNNSEIVFKADAPLVANIPIAQLKDAFLNGKIEFSNTYSSNISLKIIGKENLIPLIKLSKLKEKFWNGERWLDSSVDKGIADVIGDAIGVDFEFYIDSKESEAAKEIKLKLEEVDVNEI